MFHQMLSVCFPNDFIISFRIDRILPACWLRKASFPNVFLMLRIRRIFQTLPVCFPIALRTLRIELKYNQILFRDVALFIVLQRFWQVQYQKKQRQRLLYLLDVFGFHRHSERVRKGFVMFYVNLGCSEKIWNTLEVYEQFGKSSEIILRFGKDTGNDRKAFVMF